MQVSHKMTYIKLRRRLGN